MKHTLPELIDIPAIQILMESLWRAAGIPIGIFDSDENLLVANGWQDICTRFHRTHPKAERLCRESDAFIKQHLSSGAALKRGYVEYKCKNGLVDVAMPIVIEGAHVGTVFLGQFLYGPPDEEHFRRQARSFGFDEEDYLAALRRVPIFSRRRVDDILAFHRQFVSLMATMGLQRLRQLEGEEALRQAKEAADAANRSKSDFLARMSHEIRTPMNGVMGMTQLALLEPISPKAREYLDLVQVSAKSLLDIINDILDLSKIEAGRIELRCEDFELRPAIEGVLGTLSVLAREKGLRFAAEVAPELPERVRGDRGRLGQVLVNVVGNAIKFTEEGAVSIEVRRSETTRRGKVGVLFEVRDTGIGIDAPHLSKIFESFEQAGAAVHPRYGGTGLGLTIAKYLVELMGGRIWAESRPGAGSTFRFILQLEPEDGVQSGEELEEPEEIRAPRRALRVLLAEDNAVNQILGKALLERDGHTVVVAEDGRRAADALGREAFDLVLMDIRMPEIDGDELTRLVRAGHVPGCPRDIPIVALTAHALEGDRERFLAAGMDAYLPKPIDVDAFRRVLVEVTELRPRGPGGGV
ncbi:MAG: PocR ligand-binding domain-containing protein [Deltaproteobacteria bacterium]|nr:PocR ligand-binding domain-containing protein [Deltaproteobacteria bacterium]